MKQYSEQQLVQIIISLIHHNYSSEKDILRDFKANIRGKIKSISFKQLTDNEYDQKSIGFAKEVHNELHRIEAHIIISKLSSEIIDKGREGMELSEEKKYLDGFAKDMVKLLMDAKFAPIKKAFNKIKADLRKRK